MYNELDNQSFVVYRPPVPTGRLDPTFVPAKPSEWRPSVSYKYSLNDIKNQFTPSEFFRHRLKTAGKEIRLIQRLETRWNRSFDTFSAAALKIQALFRGNQGRSYFRVIKEDLRRDLARRRSYLAAKEAFQSNDFDSAIQVCISAEENPEDLLMIKMKSQYRIRKYSDCIETARKIVDVHQRNEEAYFLSACSYCQLNQFDEAIAQLRVVTILKASCSDETYRLVAGVSVRLLPPEFDTAIDSLTQIIQRTPRDFDALLERAYCYCCIQEWSDAMHDVELILAFEPIHLKALLLRGRIHTSTRQWNEAKVDYEYILIQYPGNREAVERLKDISIFVSNAIRVDD